MPRWKPCPECGFNVGLSLRGPLARPNREWVIFVAALIAAVIIPNLWLLGLAGATTGEFNLYEGMAWNQNTILGWFFFIGLHLIIFWPCFRWLLRTTRLCITVPLVVIVAAIVIIGLPLALQTDWSLGWNWLLGMTGIMITASLLGRWHHPVIQR